MSEYVIGAGVFVLINIITWVYVYGKVSQKVQHLDETINDGLVAKVDGISRHVAKLEGIMDMLVKQHEGKK